MKQCIVCKAMYGDHESVIDCNLCNTANSVLIIADGITTQKEVSFEDADTEDGNDDEYEDDEEDNVYVNPEKLQKKKPKEPTKPISITKLDNVNITRMVFPEGIDKILGADEPGAVKGSSIIIYGEPGIGKSTLVLSFVGEVAKNGEKCLYISAEESCFQVAARARRIGAMQSKLMIVSSSIVSNIERHIRSTKAKLVIIDSVNRIIPKENDAAGGMVEIIHSSTKLAEICQKLGVVIIFIAHVTKDSILSGPKQFEHLVDVVIACEGKPRSDKRRLWSSKNRFGSTNLSASYEMGNEGMTFIGYEDEESSKLFYE